MLGMKLNEESEENTVDVFCKKMNLEVSEGHVVFNGGREIHEVFDEDEGDIAATASKKKEMKPSIFDPHREDSFVLDRHYLGRDVNKIDENGVNIWPQEIFTWILDN